MLEIFAASETQVDEAEGAVPVPLGHQDCVGGLCCPALADDETGTPFEPALRLAAVAIAIDSKKRVLLTRRPQTMRTFPGAWVLPGGSVDRTDPSIAAAAVRELEEETGLQLSGQALARLPSLMCCWESCFPVSKEKWREARAEGKRTSHYLIAYIVVEISDQLLSTSSIQLQPTECDCACWVPLRDLAGVLGYSDGRTEGRAAQSYPCIALDGSSTVDSWLLSGVYPNVAGEGVGRGHLWALRELAAQLEARRDERGRAGSP